MKSVDKYQKKEKSFLEERTEYRIIAQYGMSYHQGNSHPYFSITGSIDYRNRADGWTSETCGCIHDEIALHLPELKPLIQFHLWDDNGLPMHYVANAIYWWENWQGLSKYKAEKTKEEYLEILQQIFKLIQKDANLTKDQETYEILKSNRELAANKIQNNQYRR